VYADDDTDMDIHKIKIQCEKTFYEVISMFHEGGDKFNDEVCAVDFEFKEDLYSVDKRIIKK
jgi:hypothetical protein